MIHSMADVMGSRHYGLITLLRKLQLESWLLAWVCFMHSVQLSPGACPIF